VKKNILRVVDVNLNRSREGLRVCEEIARFILNSRTLTKDFKLLRHRLKNAYSSFPNSWRGVYLGRDSKGDVGRATSSVEMQRESTDDIFFANMQRTKESVRVLEEFSKLCDHRLSARFKRLRFDLYAIEKKALKKL